jgi:hypothetical protein
MADSESEKGDEAFEKFINENTCPNNNIALLVLVLREKVRHLSTVYNTSLGAYLKLGDSDPIRAEMGKFISKLMEQSVQSLNQFDFILMEDEEGEEEPGPIDPSGI